MKKIGKDNAGMTKNNSLKARVANKNLTDRELEVLGYVMKGLTNKEIARILMITHHTVKAHVAAILRKIGAKNRLDASMMAQEWNTISPHQG